MKNKTYGSLGFMLSLFVLSGSIILFENIYSVSDSLILNIISITVGLLITIICFIPSMLIKLKTQNSFLEYAQKQTPDFFMILSMLYSIGFVYVILYFIIKYVDAYTVAVNPDGNRFFVVFFILLLSVYSACKGENAMVRSTVILFAVTLICYAVIFIGNINIMKIYNLSKHLFVNRGEISPSLSLYSTTSFIALIFLALSDKIKKFKVKHTVIFIISTFVLFLVSIAFMWLSLGEYGGQQKVQMHLLSKTASFGAMLGMDLFYLVLSSLAIFSVISFLLICIEKISLAGLRDNYSLGAKKSINSVRSIKNTRLFHRTGNCSDTLGRKRSANINLSTRIACRGTRLVYAVICAVLFVCAEKYTAVKEILSSTYILNSLVIFLALIVPAVYFIAFRRKSYV